jgi:type IV secretory pathway component VirB8
MFGKRKSEAASDIPESVTAATEGSEGYPKSFAVASLRERRMSMSLRIMGFCMFGSLLLNISLSFVIVSLFPLKEVRPFLVQVADEGTVVASIRPIQDTFDARDLLTEKLVREYVKNRHEILRSDQVMALRWGPQGHLGVTTASDEYARFIERVKPQIEEIRRQNGERLVEIVSVSALIVGQVYIVDFRSRAVNGEDRVVEEKVYTATMEVEFVALKGLQHEQMMINPTGFQVKSFSIAEKSQ